MCCGTCSHSSSGGRTTQHYIKSHCASRRTRSSMVPQCKLCCASALHWVVCPFALRVRTALICVTFRAGIALDPNKEDLQPLGPADIFARTRHWNTWPATLNSGGCHLLGEILGDNSDWNSASRPSTSAHRTGVVTAERFRRHF